MAKKLDLQAIVSDYYADVYRIGFALTKNESEAADLTQEAFLILVKHKEQIQEPETIKSWLFTTLRRQFLRKVRTRMAHPEIEFKPEEHEVQAIELNILSSIDARTALAALQMVEENYRTALELFYLSDLSYKEISATLGVPIGTVMSRLSRGKAQLRCALAKAFEGDPKKIISLPENRESGGL